MTRTVTGLLSAVRPFGVAGLFAVLVAACSPFEEKYAAEVGYHQGASEQWDIWGEFVSLEECRDHATARYEELGQRAFSWACLKLGKDGSYLSRHR